MLIKELIKKIEVVSKGNSAQKASDPLSKSKLRNQTDNLKANNKMSETLSSQKNQQSLVKQDRNQTKKQQSSKKKGFQKEQQQKVKKIAAMNQNRNEKLRTQLKRLIDWNDIVDSFAKKQKQYPNLQKCTLDQIGQCFNFRAFLLIGMMRFQYKDLKSLSLFIINNKNLMKQNPKNVATQQLQLALTNLFEYKFQNYDENRYMGWKNEITEENSKQCLEAVKIIFQLYGKNTLNSFKNSLCQQFLDLVYKSEKQWRLELLFKMPPSIRSFKQFSQKVLKNALRNRFYNYAQCIEKVFKMLIKYQVQPSDDLFILTHQNLVTQTKTIEAYISLLSQIAQNQVKSKQFTDPDKIRSIISELFKLISPNQTKQLLGKILGKMQNYNEFINHLIMNFVQQSFLSLLQQTKRQQFFRKILENRQIDNKNKPILITLLKKHLSNQQKYELVKKFYHGLIKSNYSAIDSNQTNAVEAFSMFYKEICEEKSNFELIEVMMDNSQEIMEKINHNKGIINEIHRQIVKQFQKFFEIKSQAESLYQVLLKQKTDKLKQVKKEIQSIKKQLVYQPANKIKLNQDMSLLISKVDLLKDIYSTEVFKQIYQKNSSLSDYSLLFVSLQQFQKGFKEKIQSLDNNMTLKQFLSYFHKIGDKQLQDLLRKNSKYELYPKIQIGKTKLMLKRMKRINKFLEGVLFLSSKFNIIIQKDFFQSHSVISKSIINYLEFQQNLIDIIETSHIAFKSFLQFDSKINSILIDSNSKEKNFDRNVAVDTISAISDYKKLIEFSMDLDDKKVQNLMEFISEDEQQLIGTVKELGSVVKYVDMLKSTIKNTAQLITKTERFVEKLYELNEILKNNIQNCGSVVNSLLMKMQQSSDQSFSFKHQLESINQSSKFFIKSYDGQTWKVVCKFELDKKLIERNLDRLVQYREKTTIMNTEIYKNNADIDKETQEKLQIFKKFHSNLQHLLTISNSIIQMINSGYIPQGFVSFRAVDQQMISSEEIEEKYEEYLICQIVDSQMDLIAKRAQRIKTNKDKWTKFLVQIWKESFLACSLDGRKMRKIIVNMIVKNQFDPMLKFVLGLPQTTVLEIQRNFLESRQVFLFLSLYNHFIQLYIHFFNEKEQISEGFFFIEPLMFDLIF